MIFARLVSFALLPTVAALNPDVIIVGGGLSGLTCGSLLSQTPRSVLLLESHDTVGGCAHTWTRRTSRGTFHFESGPSLYSGLSTERSYNPLKNVFDIIGESPEIIKYDRWGTVFPNGVKLAAPIGPKGKKWGFETGGHGARTRRMQSSRSSDVSLFTNSSLRSQDSTKSSWPSSGPRRGGSSGI